MRPKVVRKTAQLRKPDLKIKKSNDDWVCTTEYSSTRCPVTPIIIYDAHIVSISDDRFDDDDYIELSSVLPGVCWKHLVITVSNTNTNVVERLMQSIAVSHPTIISLEATFDYNVPIPYRILLGADSSLLELRVKTSAHLSEEDAVAIADGLAENRTLQSLALLPDYVGHAAVEEITASLARSPTLHSFYLIGHRFTRFEHETGWMSDAGVDNLRHALESPTSTLKSLGVSLISDDPVAIHFARMIASNQTLTELWVSVVSVQPRFFELLSANRSIRELTVFMDCVCMDAIKTVAYLVREMPELVKLHVYLSAYPWPRTRLGDDPPGSDELALAISENTHMKTLRITDPIENLINFLSTAKIAALVARNATMIENPFYPGSNRNEVIAALNTTALVQFHLGTRVVVVGPERARAAAALPHSFAVPAPSGVAAQRVPTSARVQQDAYIARKLALSAQRHMAEREKPAPPIDRRLLIGMEHRVVERAPESWFTPVVADTPDAAATLAAARAVYLVAFAFPIDADSLRRLAEMYGDRTHCVAYAPVSDTTRHADRATALAAFPRAQWVVDIAALSDANFGASVEVEVPFRRLLFARQAMQETELVLAPDRVAELAAACGLDIADVRRAAALMPRLMTLGDGSLITDVPQLFAKVSAAFLHGNPVVQLQRALIGTEESSDAARHLRAYTLRGTAAVTAFRRVCECDVSVDAATDFLVRIGAIVRAKDKFVVGMPGFREGTPYLYARLLQLPGAGLVDARADGCIHFQYEGSRFAARVVADGRWVVRRGDGTTQEAWEHMRRVLLADTRA